MSGIHSRGYTLAAPGKVITDGRAELSDLQRWVLLRAFQHHCDDRSLPVLEDEEAECENLERFLADQDAQRMSRIMGGLPCLTNFPSIHCGIPHVLLPQIVAHILGVLKHDARSGDPFDNFSDLAGKSFSIIGGQTWRCSYGPRVEAAHYRAAYASASRCARRLENRGLLVRRTRTRGGIRLTAAGLTRAEELAGCRAPERGWRLYVPEWDGEKWLVHFDTESAYWLHDDSLPSGVAGESAPHGR